MVSKLRVGIIGAGDIAAVMADTLSRMKKAEAYAIASRSLERAQAFAFRHGCEMAYGSYQDMLEDRKVDLVYIATPHTFHYRHAKMCIDAGKPVLVEKPFCVNEQQARRLFSYAKRKQVFITEAIWVRYLPMYRTIMKTLQSGIIGQPRLLTANLGYELTDKKRLTDPALAGGALLDVGIYPLNFAYMVFGDDVEKVTASVVKTEQGVDMHDSITLSYRDGRMAVLHASMAAVTDRQGIIHGTKGYMIVENINNYQTLTVYDKAHKKVLHKKCPKQISGYEYELLACLDALKKKKMECPQMPHKETLHMLHVMDGVRKKAGILYPCEK